MPRLSAFERFFGRVEIAANGCWLWTGGLARGGYARFVYGGGQVYAHRWTYLMWVGEIPEGMQLDHFVCDTPRCVNPEHVRPVTPRENTLRGNTVQSLNASKTVCKWGHEFTEASTFYDKAGMRQCRPCHARRQSETRARKRVV